MLYITAQEQVGEKSVQMRRPHKDVETAAWTAVRPQPLLRRRLQHALPQHRQEQIHAAALLRARKAQLMEIRTVHLVTNGTACRNAFMKSVSELLA
jgi:hypothetical protein